MPPLQVDCRCGDLEAEMVSATITFLSPATHADSSQAQGHPLHCQVDKEIMSPAKTPVCQAPLGLPVRPTCSPLRATPDLCHTAPVIHRNLSSSTVTQSRQYAGAPPDQRLKGSFRGSSLAQRKAPLETATEESQKVDDRSSSPSEQASNTSSSSSDHSEEAGTYRSQVFKRPPHLGPAKSQIYSLGADDDDDDDDSPAFLPFSKSADVLKQAAGSASGKDTSRQAMPRGAMKTPATILEVAAESSTSSGSSSAAIVAQSDTAHSRGPAVALSPRRRAELGVPGAHRQGVARQGSDAPSVGSSKTSSSFSELDGRGWLCRLAVICH